MLPAHTVTATAPGKVNLHLGVGDVRPDGYHELCTIFQAVSLTEEVTLRRQDAPGARLLTVAGPDAHLVPTDETNLAWRAVDRIRELWAQRSGIPLDDAPQVDIHLHKGVPVAGGMAGGSADAAAALVAAVDFYFRRQPPSPHSPRPTAAPPSPAELHEIATGLGADVPFCLLGGTALGTGKGEQLVSVMCKGPLHWAIAVDKRGLSTPAVFRHLDTQRAQRAGRAQRAQQDQQVTGAQRAQQLTGAQQDHLLPGTQHPPRPESRAGSPEPLVQALAGGDPHRIAPLLVNDLHAPAISLLPSLRETLAVAREAGALAAIVSGSGPSIAMLCADADAAVDIATAVQVAGKASATVVATSPAPGARVIR